MPERFLESRQKALAQKPSPASLPLHDLRRSKRKSSCYGPTEVTLKDPALLEYAVEAASDFHVARAVGAEGEMAFAFFLSHFPRGWLPLLNQGELPVLFCFIFLYLAAAGPGPWSLDAAVRRAA